MASSQHNDLHDWGVRGRAPSAVSCLTACGAGQASRTSTSMAVDVEARSGNTCQSSMASGASSGCIGLHDR
jgi:hypothetical protein